MNVNSPPKSYPQNIHSENEIDPVDLEKLCEALYLSEIRFNKVTGTAEQLEGLREANLRMHACYKSKSKNLDLSGCKLIEVPTDILRQHFQFLETLDLSNNHFYMHATPAELCSQIADLAYCKNLRRLIIRDNCFDFVMLETIKDYAKTKRGTSNHLSIEPSPTDYLDEEYARKLELEQSKPRKSIIKNWENFFRKKFSPK